MWDSLSLITYLTVFLLCFAVCLFAICLDRESILEFLLVLAPGGPFMLACLLFWR